MDRILQGAPATIAATFYDQDGEIIDPGAVTVTVTRQDGTTVKATIATGSGAAERTLALTATDTALLDNFTVTWVSTAHGTVTTYVEVAGGFLFSIPEARAIRPMDNTSDYPTSDIKQMRTTVEQALEDYCGAFVPRFTIETLSGECGRPLQLSKRLVRNVRSISMDGIALTAGELAAITTNGSFLHSTNDWPGMPTVWTPGNENIVVAYEYGRDYPPERVRRAALLLTKVWLVAGPVDDRTSTLSTTDGGTYSLVTPGIGGSVFGVPEVDAVAQQYAMPQVA